MTEDSAIKGKLIRDECGLLVVRFHAKRHQISNEIAIDELFDMGRAERKVLAERAWRTMQVGIEI